MPVPSQLRPPRRFASRSARRTPFAVALLAVAAFVLNGCSGSEEDADLVIYSGRSEELVAGLISKFEEDSGLSVEVRYGDTAEMAAQLLEEGEQTPAQAFYSQDAGALGALSEAGILAKLPASLTDRVPPAYTSTDDTWVGVTGSARVIAYDPDKVEEADIPDDIAEFTEEEWRGEVAIAPTNASFQSFVTALRVTEGEQAAEEFLRGLVDNDAEIYADNLTMLDGLEAGEVTAGLTNHYYLHEKALEVGEENVRTQLKFAEPGTAGALVNVTGVGIIKSAPDKGPARKFADFLLSDQTQADFVETTGEFPLVEGVPGPEGLPTLEQLGGAGIDLAQLESLEKTVALLTKVGLI